MTKTKEHIVRPTVPLTKKEHKEIAIFCLENDLKIGDFIKRAAVYCTKKGIVPKKDS